MLGLMTDAAGKSFSHFAIIGVLQIIEKSGEHVGTGDSL
jgi:hypothetical protein